MILFGLLGMRFILGLSWMDSLYYVTTTLTTVGYNPPADLTEEGKLFIVVFLAVGILVIVITLGEIAERVVNRQILDALGRRRDRRLEKLSKHWIVCGLGRVGLNVAEAIAEENEAVVVVDTDEGKVETAREKGWFALRADATLEETLRACGVERAAGLIVSMSNDANNVYVTVSARSLNKDLRIIARANDLQSSGILYRVGADKVINPLLSGASAMARAALRPAVSDFLEIVHISRQFDLDFYSITLAADSSLVGVALSESPLRSRYNVLVVALKPLEKEMVYNPQGNHVFQAGDELVLLGPRAATPELRRIASGTV
ncbi:MAG: TrkA family potassium uptake protein [Synergistaceae bacterium]|nr:TrkA family potassium uptake protein [Synergistaceae bacterium]